MASLKKNSEGFVTETARKRNRAAPNYVDVAIPHARDVADGAPMIPPDFTLPQAQLLGQATPATVPWVLRDLCRQGLTVASEVLASAMAAPVDSFLEIFGPPTLSPELALRLLGAQTRLPEPRRVASRFRDALRLVLDMKRTDGRGTSGRPSDSPRVR